ncbi:MAG: PAS domain-containing protein [Hellea sp.]|nr:PAS domain-containing protein [Hellea sp.]
MKKKYLSVTELVNYRKDGSAFLNALHMAPLFDKSGKMRLFYGSQMDTTESVTVENVRRRRALKIAGVGIWEYHPDKDESFADSSMLQLFDMAEDSGKDLFRKFMVKVHPEDADLVRRATAASFDDPKIPYSVDFRIMRPGGKVRWIRSVGGMANASNGSGNRSFIGVSSDVTDEKEFEIALSEARDTIKMVADELDHRMNNIFATMAALVSAGARGESDSSKAAKKTRDRILAMANANRLTIGKGIHEDVSLQALLNRALEPYRGTAAIEIEEFDLPLSQRTLQSLGLIFHELSTNAIKYGALDSSRGCLTINWSVTKDGICTIIWKEINGEKTDFEIQSTGYGSRLIDMTVKQIGGDLERDFQSDGLEVRLSFTISQR